MLYNKILHESSVVNLFVLKTVCIFCVKQGLFEYSDHMTKGHAIVSPINAFQEKSILL